MHCMFYYLHSCITVPKKQTVVESDTDSDTPPGLISGSDSDPDSTYRVVDYESPDSYDED